jgi:hypothetical protein
LPLTPEQLRARKRRNVAIAWGLVAFMVLVFVSTLLNLQRNIRAREAMLQESAPVASSLARP